MEPLFWRWRAPTRPSVAFRVGNPHPGHSSGREGIRGSAGSAGAGGTAGGGGSMAAKVSRSQQLDCGAATQGCLWRPLLTASPPPPLLQVAPKPARRPAPPPLAPPAAVPFASLQPGPRPLRPGHWDQPGRVAAAGALQPPPFPPPAARPARPLRGGNLLGLTRHRPLAPSLYCPALGPLSPPLPPVPS